MRVFILHIVLFSGLLLKAQSPFSTFRASLQADDYATSQRILDSCSFVKYHQDSVLYYKGLLSLKKGNKKSARIFCSMLIGTYPSFSEANYLSALIYFNNENYGSAINAFTEALKFNPGHSKALYNRSLAFGLLEDYENALEDLTACITLNPNNGMVYYSRAYWYEFTGKFMEAKNDYEKSIQLDPKNYDAYFGLAWIYQNQKESTKACETITRAIGAGSQIAEELKENFCR